jgi:hypothetical protein
MPRIEADYIEPLAAQLMNQLGCHGTGLDANPGIRPGVTAHSLCNLVRHRAALAAPDPRSTGVYDADNGRLLRYVQTHKIAHDDLRWLKSPDFSAWDRSTIRLLKKSSF